jgi:hypothetical protein
MKFLVYTNLKELPDRYDSFWESQKQISLYLTRSWFENLVEFSFEIKDKCRIFVVEDDQDSQPLLMLLTREPGGQNGSIYVGWKLTCGSLASLTNYQSGFYAPLSAPMSEKKLAVACRCLVGGLARQPSPYYFIDLNLMDRTSSLFGYLADAFKSEGYWVYPYFYKGNWFESLGVWSFADYVSQRHQTSRRVIQNFQRKQRKMIREGRLQVTVMSSEDELPLIMDSYCAVYGKSWKQTDFYPQFLEGLIRLCARDGSLRFSLVTVDGRPAAFEFAIVQNAMAIMMRTAYVMDYHRYSVGAIAIVTMLEYLIDVDRVRSIDFGTDDDSYKKTWVQNRRELWGLTCINLKTFKGQRAGIRLGWRKMDRWVRDLVKVLIKKYAFR